MTAGIHSARGPLKVMRVSPHFRDYVLDQLADLRGLRAQAMFGGVGLYAEDVFFGLVAADVLYFKVDDTTRSYYEAAGSKPFKPYADQPTTMSYYEVPIEVLESTSTLMQWARQAVQVAYSSKNGNRTTKVESVMAKKTAKKKKVKVADLRPARGAAEKIKGGRADKWIK